MLPPRHRLRTRRDFTRTVKHGRRLTAGRVTGYLCFADPVASIAAGAPARVGLIVSRQVGNAVARHRVARVLRHAAAEHFAELPAGARVVLRALPGSAERDRALAIDVARIVARATEQTPHRADANTNTNTNTADADRPGG